MNNFFPVESKILVVDSIIIIYSSQPSLPETMSERGENWTR